MRHVKTIKAASGHLMAICKLDPNRQDHPGFGRYTDYYQARNFTEEGVIFFYLAKGYEDAPNQICVWYKNKKMWSSFGKNFKEAIDGAQRDGWLAAE